MHEIIDKVSQVNTLLSLTKNVHYDGQNLYVALAEHVRVYVRQHYNTETQKFEYWPLAEAYVPNDTKAMKNVPRGVYFNSVSELVKEEENLFVTGAISGAVMFDPTKTWGMF